MIGFVVMAVKGLFFESKSGMDGLGKLEVPTSCCQVFVNVVHMSYVEFHCVLTSRSMMCCLRPRVLSTLYHLGRTMVGEFLIALDTP